MISEQHKAAEHIRLKTHKELAGCDCQGNSGLEMVGPAFTGWRCKRCGATKDSRDHGKKQIDLLFKLARLARNTDGLYPSTWGIEVSHLLLELRGLDEDRYQREVMDK